MAVTEEMRMRLEESRLVRKRDRCALEERERTKM